MIANATETILQRFPNPHVVAWHVRCCLTTYTIVACDSKDDVRDSTTDRRTLVQKFLNMVSFTPDHFKKSRQAARRLRSLFESLFAVDGVTRVSITPYQIDVAKGYAFTWEELEPQITDVIDQYLASIAGK